MQHFLRFVTMLSICITAANAVENPMPEHMLKNPVTVEYLQQHLKKETPRLILTAENEQMLRERIKTDPVIKTCYEGVREQADEILAKPVLEYKMEGRRLLSTSRDMLNRMGILGLVYRIERDSAALVRMDAELLAVCNFTSWNPSHFLDVAEMSMAVALAVDWVGSALPAATLQLAKTALLEKGIEPGADGRPENWWINRTNNWNQVCHGGLIAAALVIADEHPETAARVISRALDNLPHALNEYGPDGIYPEGPMYWGYGTAYSVLTIEMLRSALGTDFGLAAYPGFMESARFVTLATAPSGDFFNYADCRDRPGKSGDVILAWFAAETGDPLFYEHEKFLKKMPPEGDHPRFMGPALVWMSRYREGKAQPLPQAWYGNGHTPLVIMRNDNAEAPFYLGVKGGQGAQSHGNMDVGSFVLEMDGVRWSVDLGKQGYHAVEKTGFNLWGMCQECDRWKLLTKNNYGHSTVTVNGALHVADGFGKITSFSDRETPSATVDMTPVLGAAVDRAVRTFHKESDRSVIIEDTVTVNDSTETITWQLMTLADVQVQKNGALLTQDGKKLNLQVLSPAGAVVEVVSLNPPPHELDKIVEGLKRVEVRLDTKDMKPGSTGIIKIRLTTEKN